MNARDPNLAQDLGEQMRELLPEAAESVIKDMLDMNPEQFREWKKSVDDKMDAEKTARKIEIAERTIDGMDRSYVDQCRRYVGRDETKYPGLRFGRAIRAMAGAQQHKISVEDYAKFHLRSPWLADDFAKAREEAMHVPQEQRGLVSTSVSAGGAITPTEYVADMIEQLKAEAVIRSSPGVRSIPMESGSLEMPRKSGAATATYRGEAVADTATDQTFEVVTMTGRKLIASTAVSNDLIRQSNPAADDIVSTDLMEQMALREDLAFIRGDGTASTPKGIRNWVQAANVSAASISSLATLITTLTGMMNDLVGNNVKLRSPFWLMHSRTFFGILGQTDTTGQPFAYNSAGLLNASQPMAATLFGFPIRVSTQIPITQGAGSDESELTLVEGSECLIGDVYDLMVTTHDGAAYYDGANVQSAASRDETLVRAISKHDFLLRHVAGGSVRTGVTLGS